MTMSEKSLVLAHFVLVNTSRQVDSLDSDTEESDSVYPKISSSPSLFVLWLVRLNNVVVCLYIQIINSLQFGSIDKCHTSAFSTLIFIQDRSDTETV